MEENAKVSAYVGELMKHIYKSIQDIDYSSTVLADIRDNELSLEENKLVEFNSAIEAKKKFIQDIDNQIQKNLTKISSEAIEFYDSSVLRHNEALNELINHVGFFNALKPTALNKDKKKTKRVRFMEDPILVERIHDYNNEIESKQDYYELENLKSLLRIHKSDLSTLQEIAQYELISMAYKAATKEELDDLTEQHRTALDKQKKNILEVENEILTQQEILNSKIDSYKKGGAKLDNSIQSEIESYLNDEKSRNPDNPQSVESIKKASSIKNIMSLRDGIHARLKDWDKIQQVIPSNDITYHSINLQNQNIDDEKIFEAMIYRELRNILENLDFYVEIVTDITSYKEKYRETKSAINQSKQNILEKKESFEDQRKNLVANNKTEEVEILEKDHSAFVLAEEQKIARLTNAIAILSDGLDGRIEFFENFYDKLISNTNILSLSNDLYSKDNALDGNDVQSYKTDIIALTKKILEIKNRTINDIKSQNSDFYNMSPETLNNNVLSNEAENNLETIQSGRVSPETLNNNVLSNEAENNLKTNENDGNLIQESKDRAIIEAEESTKQAIIEVTSLYEYIMEESTKSYLSYQEKHDELQGTIRAYERIYNDCESAPNKSNFIDLDACVGFILSRRSKIIDAIEMDRKKILNIVENIEQMGEVSNNDNNMLLSKGSETATLNALMLQRDRILIDASNMIQGYEKNVNASIYLLKEYASSDIVNGYAEAAYDIINNTNRKKEYRRRPPVIRHMQKGHKYNTNIKQNDRELAQDQNEIEYATIEHPPVTDTNIKKKNRKEELNEIEYATIEHPPVTDTNTKKEHSGRPISLENFDAQSQEGREYIESIKKQILEVQKCCDSNTDIGSSIHIFYERNDYPMQSLMDEYTSIYNNSQLRNSKQGKSKLKQLSERILFIRHMGAKWLTGHKNEMTLMGQRISMIPPLSDDEHKILSAEDGNITLKNLINKKAEMLEYANELFAARHKQISDNQDILALYPSDELQLKEYALNKNIGTDKNAKKSDLSQESSRAELKKCIKSLQQDIKEGTKLYKKVKKATSRMNNLYIMKNQALEKAIQAYKNVYASINVVTEEGLRQELFASIESKTNDMLEFIIEDKKFLAYFDSDIRDMYERSEQNNKVLDAQSGNKLLKNLIHQNGVVLSKINGALQEHLDQVRYNQTLLMSYPESEIILKDAIDQEQDELMQDSDNEEKNINAHMERVLSCIKKSEKSIKNIEEVSNSIAYSFGRHETQYRELIEHYAKVYSDNKIPHNDTVSSELDKISKVILSKRDEVAKLIKDNQKILSEFQYEIEELYNLVGYNNELVKSGKISQESMHNIRYMSTIFNNIKIIMKECNDTINLYKGISSKYPSNDFELRKYVIDLNLKRNDKESRNIDNNGLIPESNTTKMTPNEAMNLIEKGIEKAKEFSREINRMLSTIESSYSKDNNNLQHSIQDFIDTYNSHQPERVIQELIANYDNNQFADAMQDLIDTYGNQPQGSVIQAFINAYNYAKSQGISAQDFIDTYNDRQLPYNESFKKTLEQKVYAILSQKDQILENTHEDRITLDSLKDKMHAMRDAVINLDNEVLRSSDDRALFDKIDRRNEALDSIPKLFERVINQINRHENHVLNSLSSHHILAKYISELSSNNQAVEQESTAAQSIDDGISNATKTDMLEQLNKNPLFQKGGSFTENQKGVSFTENKAPVRSSRIGSTILNAEESVVDDEAPKVPVRSSRIGSTILNAEESVVDDEAPKVPVRSSRIGSKANSVLDFEAASKIELDNSAEFLDKMDQESIQSADQDIYKEEALVTDLVEKNESHTIELVEDYNKNIKNIIEHLTLNKETERYFRYLCSDQGTTQTIAPDYHQLGYRYKESLEEVVNNSKCNHNKLQNIHGGVTSMKDRLYRFAIAPLKTKDIDVVALYNAIANKIASLMINPNRALVAQYLNVDNRSNRHKSVIAKSPMEYMIGNAYLKKSMCPALIQWQLGAIDLAANIKALNEVHKELTNSKPELATSLHCFENAKHEMPGINDYTDYKHLFGNKDFNKIVANDFEKIIGISMTDLYKFSTKIPSINKICNKYIKSQRSPFNKLKQNFSAAGIKKNLTKLQQNFLRPKSVKQNLSSGEQKKNASSFINKLKVDRQNTEIKR